MRKPKRNYHTKPVRISDKVHKIAKRHADREDRSVRSFVERAIQNEADQVQEDERQ